MNVTRHAVTLITLLGISVLAGCMSEISGPDSDAVNGERLAATEVANVVGRGFIWADGILYRTVATPAHFKPGHGTGNPAS